MSETFECPRCGDVFNRKDTLITHLKRKRKCNPKNSIEECEAIIKRLSYKVYNEKTYDCDFCGKRFNHSSCKCKHKQICKKNPINCTVEVTNTNEAHPHVQPASTSTVDTDVYEKHVVVFCTQVIDEIKTQVEKQMASAVASLIEERTFIEVIAKKTIDTVMKHFQQHITTSHTITDMESEENNNVPQEMIETQVDLAKSPQNSTKKKKIKPAKRMEVWKKYIGLCHGEAKCLCCKSNTINTFTFHCGHVKSEADGGTIELSNLRPICSLCNSSMGTTNMIKFAKEQFDVDIV
jgi:uncharacterized C2H2 Zn-finger protein